MTKKKSSQSIIPSERIERSILLVRGHKVLLDSDLAKLYGVETKALTRAVRRNLDRFPGDFLLQLSEAEFDDLKRQFGTSSQWGGRRYAPYAFTEQGVAMLSSVLHSKRSIAVNVEIMRAFVRLREMLSSHAELARRLNELEMKYDSQFRAVFDAIRQLMIPPATGPKRRIGFHARQGD
ncbi:MAG: ORF6N domain-containing protein [Pirellulales bacterium]